jgi:hypothetical protein
LEKVRSSEIANAPAALAAFAAFEPQTVPSAATAASAASPEKKSEKSERAPSPAPISAFELQGAFASDPSVPDELTKCRSAEAGFGAGDHHAKPAPDGPQGWRDALLRLSPDRDPCPGFRRNAWVRVWTNALDFIERHGDEAHGLGWTAPELFGVHPAVGVIRVDHCGALMLTVAGRVLAVEADAIRFANGHGRGPPVGGPPVAGLTFRRSFGSGESVLVWTFGQADRRTPP